MTNTVIVLDGEQRAALAVTRSLGQRGLRVIVCSARATPLAGASRWCYKTHQVPDVAREAQALAPALQLIAERECASLIVPITDASVTALIDFPVSGEVTVATPPKPAYKALSDKGELVKRAKALDVPVPDSVIVETPEAYRQALADWRGRVVIKPAFSRYLANGAVRSTTVVTAENATEALALLPDLEWLGSVPCVLQAFVPGRGAGIFAVYGNDGSLAWFSHQRLREKPPTGGVSVYSQSAAPDPKMRSYAQALLDSADWSGPAMVEFRVDDDGKPWLMEINGRLWGSLQLAVDSGIDVPWLWYQAASGYAVSAVEAYTAGQRLRWLLGDVDNLYLTARRRDLSTSDKLMAFLRFLNFFTRNTRLEVLRLNDPRPFLRELKTWLSALFGKGAGR